MREEYEVKFKPIVITAESPQDAEAKAIREVELGNLEVDSVDLY